MLPSNRLTLFILYVCLPFQYGCTTHTDFWRKNSGISEDVFNIEPQIVPVDRKQVIHQYRQFVKTATVGTNYYHALVRLADLELEQGEENVFSSDEQVSNAARKIINRSIKHYQIYLNDSGDASFREAVLYQMARAFTMVGDYNKALETLTRLASQFPQSEYRGEVQYRRAEILFSARRYTEAAKIYQEIVDEESTSRFYEDAQYKLAWSLFKDNRVRQAIIVATQLLDSRLPVSQKQYIELPADLPKPVREVVEDTIRLMCLSFFHIEDNQYIARHFAAVGEKVYEPVIFKQLSRLYMDRSRAFDSAAVSSAFIDRHYLSSLAPEFSLKLIDLYKKENEAELLLQAKETFVTRFGVKSEFWLKQSEELQTKLKPELELHIRDLARHYHARTSLTKNQKDYSQAAFWYATYIFSFPANRDTVRMNFMLAEILFDAGDYVQAVNEYERTAYAYSEHIKDSEAGYAALLCYQKIREQLSDKEWNVWQGRAISSAFRFVEKFSQHRQTPSVLTRLGHELFMSGEYQRALDVASRVLSLRLSGIDTLQMRARITASDSLYALKRYQDAEKSYSDLLHVIDKKSKHYQKANDRLVHSIYQQGAAYRDATNYQLAAYHFMRASKVVAVSKHLPTAAYDAAVMYMKLNDWNRAIVALQEFRKRFPLLLQFERGIAEKLAIAYGKTGQRREAAKEMLALADKYGDAVYQKDMLWLAAEMYHKAGDDKDAAKIYKTFIERNPGSLTQSVEALYFLVEYYGDTDQTKTQSYWLNKLLKKENRAGSNRTDRSTYLAAKSALQLAHAQREVYEEIKLKIPLKKSMRKKIKTLKNAVKAYEAAMVYAIEDIFTESAFHVAELYRNFSKEMMQSQRPKGLSVAELEQYELLLEEQAFPFEEKAIAFHNLNVQSTREGVFDKYVKDSYQVLGEMVPIRYLKPEKVVGYVDILN